MKAFYLIFFVPLLGSSWCGLISPDFSDNSHSKLNGQGLQREGKQNSSIVNIKNPQQVSQTTLNHPMQNGPRGDYGSVPHGGPYVYRSDVIINYKDGAIVYSGFPIKRGYNRGSLNYGRSHGDAGSDISSHQIMKQESDGHKSGSHRVNNMYGNA